MPDTILLIVSDVHLDDVVFFVAIFFASDNRSRNMNPTAFENLVFHNKLSYRAGADGLLLHLLSRHNLKNTCSNFKCSGRMHIGDFFAFVE